MRTQTSTPGNWVETLPLSSTWSAIFSLRYETPRIRETLLLAHHSKFLSHEEFVLWYDLNKPKNLEIPCGERRFDIDDLCDDECQASFRFFRNDIYRLTEVLDLPDEIECYNGLVVDKVDHEALAMFLKRFSYPCRYADMVPLFSRPIPQICMSTNNVMNFIYYRWRRLLFDLNQPWLSRTNLERFAAAIRDRGAALENCCGFVDVTVRPISRSGKNPASAVQRTQESSCNKIPGCSSTLWIDG